MRVRMKTGVKKDGSLTANAMYALADTSAYMALAVRVPSFLTPGLYAYPHGMARACCRKFLFPAELHYHPSPGGNGQVGGYIFDQHFLLAPKTAPDARFDHADTLDRQPQHRARAARMAR